MKIKPLSLRRRCCVLAVSTVFCLSVGVLPVNAERTRGLFVGVNHVIGDVTLSHNFTTHRLDDTGFTLGLLVPIHVSKVNVYFKGQLFVHDIEDINYASDPSPSDAAYYRNLDIYMGGANGLMVGTRLDLANSFYVQPLVGFGVLVNVIYGNEGEGIAYGSFGIDLSTQLMYKLKHIDTGLQLTLQLVPWDGYFNSADQKTVNLSFLVLR
ncbi:MAG: hypothetical protein JSW58_07360 [Candidatus Latescibacterota bacterium]|nr:MAG: hypothetical protein JSW58_07360 [Candidatus Latescibacterota bacterium]